MGAVDKSYPVVPGAVFELADGRRIGEGDDALGPGAVVTVLDVVERGTPGVGRSEAEQVIVLHRYFGLPTRAADGEFVYLEHSRCIAVPVAAFAKLFQQSKKDPTPRKPVT